MSKDDVGEQNVSQEVDEFYNGLRPEEQEEINEFGKDKIIENIMIGNFRDLGGVIAMRGFMYQYYIAMFYSIAMLYDEENNWWDNVVLEYYDDVTLIGPKKIRFIQVKTVRENSINKHTPSNFTTRTKKTDSMSEENHFNSWIEKNFLLYDFFLEDAQENSNIELFVDRNSYKPEFEIITNTPSDSLQELDTYTLNTNYCHQEEIPNDEKIKSKLLKPVVNSKQKETLFQDILKEDVDFYLKRLHIKKQGPISILITDINDMIQEILNLKGIRKSSIVDYIMEKLLSKVIHGTFDDNEETLRKRNFRINKENLEQDLIDWEQEAKELISIDGYKDTALGVFEKSINNLKDEFINDFINIGLRDDLLSTLGWYNDFILSESDEDPSSVIRYLNKLFKSNNMLTRRDFKDSKTELHLTESIRYIIYILTLYTEKETSYKEAELIYHIGISEVIDNIFFTVYHARDNLAVSSSRQRVVTSITECEILDGYPEKIYCLVLGDKPDFGVSDEVMKGAPLKLINNNASTSLPAILDVPDKVYFINLKYFEEFFKLFKSNKDINTFHSDEILNYWKKKLTTLLITESGVN